MIDLIFTPSGRISKLSLSQLKDRSQRYCPGNGGHVVALRDNSGGYCYACKRERVRLAQQRQVRLTPAQRRLLDKLIEHGGYVLKSQLTGREGLSIQALHRKGKVREDSISWIVMV